MRNSSSLDWLRFMHTPNDYRVSPCCDTDISMYISSMKSKTATIFVSGNECLFLSTSFFLALLHGGSVPIIVGTMNNYVNFLFEIKTQPGVLLRPKR